MSLLDFFVDDGGDPENNHKQCRDRADNDKQNGERDAGFENAFDDSHRIFRFLSRSCKPPFQGWSIAVAGAKFVSNASRMHRSDANGPGIIPGPFDITYSATQATIGA